MKMLFIAFIVCIKLWLMDPVVAYQSDLSTSVVMLMTFANSLEQDWA